MNTRLKPQIRYTIEDLTGLASKSDWFIHNDQLLNITNTETPKIVFMSMFLGKTTIRFFATVVLPKIKNKFNLVVASDDFTFPTGTGDKRTKGLIMLQREIRRIMNNNFINKIFVENLDTLHDKLIPIPLGVLKYGKRTIYDDLIEYSPHSSEKKYDCFCCHRNRYNSIQWEPRQRVSEYCKNEWANFIYVLDNISEQKYKQTLLDSKFTICVQGGGIDPSPKAFCAILCGSIPIIKRSTLDDAYSKFPVVFVNEWTSDCITKEKLDKWYNELKHFYINVDERKKILQLMTLDFWFELISKIK